MAAAAAAYMKGAAHRCGASEDVAQRSIASLLFMSGMRIVEAHHTAQHAGGSRAIVGRGAESVGSTPQQFDRYIKSEIAKWAKVVKLSGARAD
jgi:hypothetical protein